MKKAETGLGSTVSPRWKLIDGIKMVRTAAECSVRKGRSRWEKIARMSYWSFSVPCSREACPRSCIVRRRLLSRLRLAPRAKDKSFTTLASSVYAKHVPWRMSSLCSTISSFTTRKMRRATPFGLARGFACVASGA